MHYLNKKSLTWKQAVPTENPFPIWSQYNRDFPCQDLVLPKRTWLFFPCSIAAKNRMGNYAAVQPAVILFFQAGALLCSYSWKFQPVLLLCPMFFFWYQFYTVCIKIHKVYIYTYIMFLSFINRVVCLCNKSLKFVILMLAVFKIVFAFMKVVFIT